MSARTPLVAVTEATPAATGLDWLGPGPNCPSAGVLGLLLPSVSASFLMGFLHRGYRSPRAAIPTPGAETPLRRKSVFPCEAGEGRGRGEWLVRSC